MKEKITYLDLVFPLCIIYTTGLCLWSYFIRGTEYANPFGDVFITLILSSLFCYGVAILVKEIYNLGGLLGILKDITK
jgi:hypothetical protein